MAKGLARIPSDPELARAYDEFSGGIEFAPDRIALLSQWARFDPRLSEILVAYLARNWSRLSPIELREALLPQAWPAAFGVLTEQACLYFEHLSPGSNDLDPLLLKQWASLVMTGIPPADGELFFIGLRAFGGIQARQDAIGSVKSYRRWGYLGREILINKASILGVGATHLPAQARRAILDEMLAKRARITVSDYIDQLGGQVHRRQAERDLARHPSLEAGGMTRGREYRVVGRSMRRIKKTPKRRGL